MQKKYMWICSAAGAAAGALLAAGAGFIHFALKPAHLKKHRHGKETGIPQENTDPEQAAQWKALLDRDAVMREWMGAKAPIQVEITSKDGLKLAGEVLFAGRATTDPAQAKEDDPQDGHRWALLVHGYNANRESMYRFGKEYYEHGYHLLMMDLRGQGESEGRWIGMGWPDRCDLQCWIDWIVKRDPCARIVMHGVSMGASAVVMTAGEPLPANVGAVIEDSGYTDVMEIFRAKLHDWFHLPAFPLLYLCDVMSKIFVGYGFREASALRQVKKCTIPALFIHGDEDQFVNVKNAYLLYDAAECRKDCLIVPGAGHTSGEMVDHKGYWDKVFSFLKSAGF